MIHMTELEEQLAQPDGAGLRDRLVWQLKEIELRLRRPVLLPPLEFGQAAALANAAQAAQEILATWPVGPTGGPLH